MAGRRSLLRSLARCGLSRADRCFKFRQAAAPTTARWQLGCLGDPGPAPGRPPRPAARQRQLTGNKNLEKTLSRAASLAGAETRRKQNKQRRARAAVVTVPNFNLKLKVPATEQSH